MLVALLLSLTLFATDSEAAPPTASATQEVAAQGITAAELQLALRDLWTGHIFWVRSYVFATHYEDAPSAEAADAEAVKNARALADAIIPFYGQEAGDQLFQLLAGHYGAIKSFAQARYGGSAEARQAATDDLMANARKIAAFLVGANPHLPEEAVLPLLIAHGGHHLQQIEAINQGDFAGEAKVWEMMLGHIYTIADAMAGALAKQFPEKVSG